MTMRGNYSARFHAEEAADHLAIAAERAERAVAAFDAAATTERAVKEALAFAGGHRELALAHGLVALALAATMHESVEP